MLLLREVANGDSEHLNQHSKVANVNPMTKSDRDIEFFLIQGSLTAAQYGSMSYDSHILQYLQFPLEVSEHWHRGLP